MPQENQNDNFSVAKCRIYLNPCCKFELVCFLKTYLRKFINLDHGGTAEDQDYSRLRHFETESIQYRHQDPLIKSFDIDIKLEF